MRTIAALSEKEASSDSNCMSFEERQMQVEPVQRASLLAVAVRVRVEPQGVGKLYSHCHCKALLRAQWFHFVLRDPSAQPWCSCIGACIAMTPSLTAHGQNSCRLVTQPASLASQPAMEVAGTI